MSKKTRISRREFIAATSAAGVAAGALRAGAEAPEEVAPSSFRSPHGLDIPFARAELFPGHRQERHFTKEHLSEIAFPLGGIGTGTVSLGGSGDLRDWEIFNRPGKGKALPLTFVALWARPVDGEAVVKIVEAAPSPPFTGSHGYRTETADSGMPRMHAARFTGEYPIARVDFEDESLPLVIALEAFNPFVPLDVDDSALPVAVFHYHVTCRGPKPVDFTLAFSLLNAVGYDGVGQISRRSYATLGGNITRFRQQQIAAGATVSGFDMTSQKYAPGHVLHGSMALLTTHPQLTADTSWGEGSRQDPFRKWLDEFVVEGRADHVADAPPSSDGASSCASLAPRWRLAPGESKTITFLLAWHFPVRDSYWNRGFFAQIQNETSKVRNHYATRFENAWDVAVHAASRLPELEAKTHAFHGALFSSTLPPYVLDAVSSQAAIIRTNTGMLLEGRRFFAFEGCNDQAGCCPMNCTHVWNYAQTMAFLFPELERSMRYTDFKSNLHPDGGMAFRTITPTEAAQWAFKPAADGQMGTIMRLYREWQISGDDKFLKDLWPEAKRALEFAWLYWDADRDGVMEGEQHNTYDIDFYGPNTLSGTLYLGALRAGELMAVAVGDDEAAERYRTVRERGLKNIEQLWNGDYYIQKLPPVDQVREVGNPSHESWFVSSVESGRLRYQYGEGCLSDQLLGQWMSEILGLGYTAAPDRVRKALESIYRYNFKHNFYDHPNIQRVFAVNDEKGLLLCSWPRGNRPQLPFIYSDEVWTGVEYQVAAHLIYEGFLEEGLALVKAVRDRHDGRRRNPWNEVECGSHYIRALASWSVLLALCGYRYSAPELRLAFAPRIQPEDFRCFFAAGSAWGLYRQQIKQRRLDAVVECHFGELRARRLDLRNGGSVSATLTVVATIGPDGRRVPECVVAAKEGTIHVDLGEEVVISAGKSLHLTLQ